MTGDETALRELLQRATPELGSLKPPATLNPAPQRSRAKLIAVAAAVVVVATISITIGITRPDGGRRSSAPTTPSVHRLDHPAQLRRLVGDTPCPAPRGTPAATRSELAAFPAVAAVTCTWSQRTYAGDGQWNILIKKASAEQIWQLKAAFDMPDLPNSHTGCLDVAIFAPPLLFVDAHGRYLQPRYPIDHTCDQPVMTTIDAVRSHNWPTVVDITRLAQVRTQAEVAFGCAAGLKKLIDLEPGRDSAHGGPVFTAHPGARLTVCIFHRSHDPYSGDFVRGMRLSTAKSVQLANALTGAATTSSTCTSQRTFAVIYAARGDSVFLELGGCWRMLRDDRPATMGTATGSTVTQLLGLK